MRHSKLYFSSTAAIAIAAALAAALVVSCTPLQKLDEAIWSAGSAQGPDPASPGLDLNQGPRPAAPPIVEVAAAVLAAFGFGGMAAWLRKVRNAGNSHLAAIELRLDALELRPTE